MTWYEPAVAVTHIKAGTSGEYRSPRLNRAFHDGMDRFYRKHYAAPNSRLVNVTVYLGIGTKLLASAVHSAARHRLPGSPRG